MAITLLPTPPSRQDPINFNVRADEFLGALPTFGTEANSLATDVNNKQVTASNAATTATNAANTATTKAGEAEASADAADLSAQAANTAKLAAEAALDSFDDRYLGQKSSNPTADNDGGALLVGALYFRTTAPTGMKVWTGTAWDDAYANLASKFDKTGGAVNGNINFTGTARRITGDFSNATPVSRLSLQTSTTNGATSLQVIPNGTGTQTQYSMYTDSAVTNGPFGDVTLNGAVFRLRTGVIGTGTAVPMTFEVNGYERLRIDTGGNVLVSGGGGLGYGVGAGGAVVQATSKSTTVALNKPSGQITMHNAPLAAGATVAFQLTNSFLETSDGVVVNCIGGVSSLANYRFSYGVTANGVASIYVTNETGASLSEAIVLNFQVLKGATS